MQEYYSILLFMGGGRRFGETTGFHVIGKRGIDHCLGRGLQFVFVVIVLLVIGGC